MVTESHEGAVEQDAPAESASDQVETTPDPASVEAEQKVDTGGEE